MIAAVTATGSFTEAGKLLGVDDSTIHCRLKHLRGTPEWDKIVAETQPDVAELRKKLAQGLNELYGRAVEELKSLSGIKFLTGFGILSDKYARLTGETPVFNNNNAVQLWQLPAKEQAEFDTAFEKLKGRLAVKVDATQNGK